MVLLSSLHIHQVVPVAQVACGHCVEQTAHQAHLSSLQSIDTDECLLCRFLWMAAMAASVVSMAAPMVVMAIVGSVNYISTLHTMQANGMLAYSELAAPVARDGNELNSIMEEAYNLIGAGELDQAIDAIADAKTKAQEALSEPIETEEDEYTHEVLQQELYDLEWYEAIVLMRKGKLVQARKVLNAIASSDSPYADNAQKELKIIL